MMFDRYNSLPSPLLYFQNSVNGMEKRVKRKATYYGIQRGNGYLRRYYLFGRHLICRSFKWLQTVRYRHLDH